MGTKDVARLAKEAPQHVENLKDPRYMKHIDFMSLEYTAANAIAYNALVKEMSSIKTSLAAPSVSVGNVVTGQSIDNTNPAAPAQDQTSHTQQPMTRPFDMSLLDQLNNLIEQENPRRIYVDDGELTTSKPKAQSMCESVGYTISRRLAKARGLDQTRTMIHIDGLLSKQKHSEHVKRSSAQDKEVTAIERLHYSTTRTDKDVLDKCKKVYRLDRDLLRGEIADVLERLGWTVCLCEFQADTCIAQRNRDIPVTERANFRVITNDSDFFVYEDIESVTIPVKGVLTTIFKKEFLEYLGLQSARQLLWAAMFTTNDYFKGGYGYGFLTNIKFVKDNSSLPWPTLSMFVTRDPFSQEPIELHDAFDLNRNKQELVENQVDMMRLFVKLYLDNIIPKIKESEKKRNKERRESHRQLVHLHTPEPEDFDHAISAFIRIEETVDDNPPKPPRTHERIKTILEDTLKRQVDLNLPAEKKVEPLPSNRGIYDAWTNVSLLRLETRRLEQQVVDLQHNVYNITGVARQEARANAVQLTLSRQKQLEDFMKASVDYARLFPRHPRFDFPKYCGVPGDFFSRSTVIGDQSLIAHAVVGRAPVTGDLDGQEPSQDEKVAFIVHEIKHTKEFMQGSLSPAIRHRAQMDLRTLLDLEEQIKKNHNVVTIAILNSKLTPRRTASADGDSSSPAQGTDPSQLPASSTAGDGQVPPTGHIDPVSLETDLKRNRRRLKDLQDGAGLLVHELWQRRDNELQLLITDQARIRKELGQFFPRGPPLQLAPCRASSPETAELEANIKPLLYLDDQPLFSTADVPSDASQGPSSTTKGKTPVRVPVGKPRQGTPATAKKQDQQLAGNAEASTSGRITNNATPNPYETRTDIGNLRNIYNNLYQLATNLCHEGDKLVAEEWHLRHSKFRFLAWRLDQVLQRIQQLNPTFSPLDPLDDFPIRQPLQRSVSTTSQRALKYKRIHKRIKEGITQRRKIEKEKKWRSSRYRPRFDIPRYVARTVVPTKNPNIPADDPALVAPPPESSPEDSKELAIEGSVTTTSTSKQGTEAGSSSTAKGTKKREPKSKSTTTTKTKKEQEKKPKRSVGLGRVFGQVAKPGSKPRGEPFQHKKVIQQSFALVTQNAGCARSCLSRALLSRVDEGTFAKEDIDLIALRMEDACAICNEARMRVFHAFQMQIVVSCEEYPWAPGSDYDGNPTFLLAPNEQFLRTLLDHTKGAMLLRHSYQWALNDKPMLGVDRSAENDFIRNMSSDMYRRLKSCYPPGLQKSNHGNLKLALAIQDLAENAWLTIAMHFKQLVVTLKDKIKKLGITGLPELIDPYEKKETTGGRMATGEAGHGATSREEQPQGQYQRDEEEVQEIDEEEELRKTKFGPDYIQMLWTYHQAIPEHHRPAFFPMVGFKDTFIRFEERALVDILWGYHQRDSSHCAPVEVSVRKLFETVMDAHAAAKQDPGFVLFELFYGDRELIAKSETFRLTNYGKSTCTMSHFGEYRRSTEAMTTFVNGAKMFWKELNTCIESGASVTSSMPRFRPNLDRWTRYILSNYVLFNGLEVHFLAYDSRRPVRRNIFVRDLTHISPTESKQFVNNFTGVDPGERVTASFCLLSPNPDPEVPKQGCDSIHKVQGKLKESKPLAVKGQSGRGSSSLVSANTPESGATGDTSQIPDKTVINLSITRKALFQQSFKYRQELEVLKQYRGPLQAGNVSFSLWVPKDFEWRKHLLPLGNDGDEQGTLTESPGVQELESMLLPNSYQSRTDIYAIVQTRQHLYPSLHTFYASMKLKKMAWELKKALKSERDKAASAVLKKCPQPTLFTYGKAKFRSKFNLSSPHDTFRMDFASKTGTMADPTTWLSLVGTGSIIDGDRNH
ncbi:hypothetical protein BGZ83_000057 [Gryganskiella cystojenkinii]|nr:hypothetical protein BGZ83_000057 [Gryganskiella cystojenkinii]